MALGIGRLFAKLTPGVRHVFTAPEAGVSPTKVKGTHWNAVHSAPDIEAGIFAGAVLDPVDAGTTQLFGAGENWWEERLEFIAYVQAQGHVFEASAGAAVALQYTTDLTGAAGWTALGVSFSAATTGRKASARVATPVGAAGSAGVLLRWVVTV